MADEKKIFAFTKQIDRLKYSIYVYSENQKAKELPNEEQLVKMFIETVREFHASMIEAENSKEALDAARKQIAEEEQRKKEEAAKGGVPQ